MSTGVAEASVGAAGLLGFLAGIKELVQKFENAERASVGPVLAWVPPAGGAGEASAAIGGAIAPAASIAVTLPVVEATVSSGPQGTAKAAGAGETAARQDFISIADAAKCEVYVCYEGPL